MKESINGRTSRQTPNGLRALQATCSTSLNGALSLGRCLVGPSRSSCALASLGTTPAASTQSPVSAFHLSGSLALSQPDDVFPCCLPFHLYPGPAFSQAIMQPISCLRSRDTRGGVLS